MPSVSEPASIEEAAALFREVAASAGRVSIGCAGGDVELSTGRLNRILEHEAGDLTCVVEAGVRLSELNAHLATRGQMLALDPPGDPTVGACIALGLSGPRRHRFGGTRDLLIGVTVVLADGTVASSGGKVVKNVAGYDLGKLFCGSRGTLGLVARAAFRLHPQPAVARTVVAPAESPAAAHTAWQTLLRSPLVPSAVDLLWPGRLGILFEGCARAVDDQVARASALVGAREAEAAIWAEARGRQALARGRLHYPPGRLADALVGRLEALARVSAGVAYVPEVVATELPAAVERLTQRLRAELDPGGVLV